MSVMVTMKSDTQFVGVVFPLFFSGNRVGFKLEVSLLARLKLNFDTSVFHLGQCNTGSILQPVVDNAPQTYRPSRHLDLRHLDPRL